MTAQWGEMLLFQGKELEMQTEPLSEYLALRQDLPPFQETWTACRRGYVGVWEITLDRLYLVGIGANWEDETEVELDKVFPGFPDRVFAHWYSGKIRCSQGELLEYVHGGYGSIYEKDLFITFKDGVVRDTRLITNSLNEQDPYRSRMMFEDIHENDIQPQLQAVELVSRHTITEIESLNLIEDPLEAVPNVPFGHLNFAWEQFKQHLRDRDELWHYRTNCLFDSPYARSMMGYVIVRNSEMGERFVTDREIVVDRA